MTNQEQESIDIGMDAVVCGLIIGILLNGNCCFAINNISIGKWIK